MISKKLQENTWYWVDATNININADVASPAFPLLEGKKAFVVTPQYYVESDYASRSVWQAFRFKKIHTPEGEKYALSHRVYIAHWGKKVSLYKDIYDSMNIDSLKNGTYCFKIRSDRNATQININDVALLKSYYRVKVSVAEDGTRTVTSKIIRPLVAEYHIYDYYPSGWLKQRVLIAERGLLGAPKDDGTVRHDPVKSDRDAYIEYEVRDRRFNDKGVKQTSAEEEKITRLTDKNSPYWVQKILSE